jgi:hypothetical protein
MPWHPFYPVIQKGAAPLSAAGGLIGCEHVHKSSLAGVAKSSRRVRPIDVRVKLVTVVLCQDEPAWYDVQSFSRKALPVLLQHAGCWRQQCMLLLLLLLNTLTVVGPLKQIDRANDQLGL